MGQRPLELLRGDSVSERLGCGCIHRDPCGGQLPERRIHLYAVLIELGDCEGAAIACASGGERDIFRYIGFAVVCASAVVSNRKMIELIGVDTGRRPYSHAVILSHRRTAAGIIEFQAVAVPLAIANTCAHPTLNPE